MKTLSSNIGSCRKKTGLLSLAAEVREAIILEVLRYVRKPPLLTPEVVEQCARLINCFDQNGPNESNIYVRRATDIRVNGDALLATNRVLRQETLALIDRLEKGTIKADGMTYVMDLMIIKDIGLMPSWRSYPYIPQRIKKLHIDVRLVRPSDGLIPTEWMFAAKYERLYAWDEYINTWNVRVVLALFALNLLRFSPSEKEDAGPTQLLDAHLRAIDEAPFVEEIFLDFKELEVFPNGEMIPPGTPDERREIGFAIEGYVSFLATWLNKNYLVDWGDWLELEKERESGKLEVGELSGEISSLLDDLVNNCDDEEGAETFVKAIEDKVGSIRTSNENGYEIVWKAPIVP